jgi:type IV pilus assembly protein PilW
MVAMAISLILFAGAVGIYLSSKSTYVDNDRLARLQDAGRIALDLVARDIRNAGYHGCVRLDGGRFTNVLNGGAGSMLFDFRFPVTGWDHAAGAWSSGGNGAPYSAAIVPSATAGSDIVAIRGPFRVNQNLRLTAGTTALTSDLLVNPPDPSLNPATGDLMMVTDCEYTSVFQVSSFDTVTGAIRHVAGGTPGNVSNQLGSAFTPAGQVLPLRTVIYYVRPSGTGSGPALWRRVNRGAAEELIEGVERLQLTYGIDTNTDGLVDRFENARLITDWRQVVSVRISMLVRTPTEEGTMLDTATYEMLDAGAFGPANDRRQRALFETTVSLRNWVL